MMLNALFYKLKDMRRAKNQNSTNSNSHSLIKKTVNFFYYYSTTIKTKTNTPKKKKRNPQPLSVSKNSFIFFTTEISPSHKFYNSPTKTKPSDIHFPDLPRKSTRQRRLKRRTTRSGPMIVSSSLLAVAVVLQSGPSIILRQIILLFHCLIPATRSHNFLKIIFLISNYRYDKVLALNQSFHSMEA